MALSSRGIGGYAFRSSGASPRAFDGDLALALPRDTSPLWAGRAGGSSRVGSPTAERPSLARHLAERQQQRQAEWDKEVSRWQKMAESSPVNANSPKLDYQADLRLSNCERDADRMLRDVAGLQVTLPRHEDALSALDRRYAELDQRLRVPGVDKRLRPSSPLSFDAGAAAGAPSALEEALIPLRAELVGMRGLVLECRTHCEERCRQALAKSERNAEMLQAYSTSINERVSELERLCQARPAWEAGEAPPEPVTVLRQNVKEIVQSLRNHEGHHTDLDGRLERIESDIRFCRERCGGDVLANPSGKGDVEQRLLQRRVDELERLAQRQALAPEPRDLAGRVEGLARTLEAKDSLLEARLSLVEGRLMNASTLDVAKGEDPRLSQINSEISRLLSEAHVVLDEPGLGAIASAEALTGTCKGGGGAVKPEPQGLGSGSPAVLWSLARKIGKVDDMCRQALERPGSLVSSHAAQQVRDRIDRIQQLCQGALGAGEAGAELSSRAPGAGQGPARLVAEVRGKIAKAEQLCDGALDGTCSGGRLDGHKSVALQGPFINEELKSKIAMGLTKLDKLCETALGNTAEPEQAGGRPPSPLSQTITDGLVRLDTLCQQALAGGAAGVDLTPSTEQDVSGTMAGRSSPHVNSFGGSPATAASRTDAAEAADHTAPRVGELVSQLHALTPGFFQMSEEIHKLVATQKENDAGIQHLRTHLVATQEELTTLKSRLREWMQNLTRLQSMQS